MPTGTPLTRDEIIQMLSQCGNLSYAQMVNLFYSIPFLSDSTSPDAFVSKFTGQWNSADSDKGKYDTDFYTVFNNTIYKSSVNNNKSLPGSNSSWVTVGDYNSANYLGKASEDTQPGTPTDTVLYTAGPGTLPNFKDSSNQSIVIPDGNFASLSWNVTGQYWDVTLIPVLTEDKNLAYVTGPGHINISRGNGKAEVIGQLFIVTSNNFNQITEGAGDFKTVGGAINGLCYIYYNKSTSLVDVYNYTALGTLDKDNNILLGILYEFAPGSLVTASINKIYLGGVLDYEISYNLSFASEIIFNNNTGVLKLPGLLLSNVNGGAAGINENTYANPQNPNPFTFNLQPNGQALIFDRALFDLGQFPFIIKNVGDSYVHTKEMQIIGVNFNNNFTSIYNVVNSNLSLTNGLRALIAKSEAFIIGSGYVININSVTKKLSTVNGPGGLWLSTANSYAPINTGETDRLDADGSLFFVWVKKSDMKIYYSGYENVANYPLEDWYFIGSFWNYDVESFKGNVRLSINGITQNGSVIVPTGESLLPKNIYLVTGKSLPLYKASIKRNKIELSAKTALVELADAGNDSNFNFPYYEFFENQIILNPAVLKDSIQINSIDVNDSTKYFVSPVNIIKRDPSDLNYSTIKGSQIGDSLTNRGVSKYVAAYLLGFTVFYETFGTLNNQGKQGEGREGWTYSNFIGRDNFFDFGGIPITRMPIPSDGDGNKNPFLKLATTADKNAHPDWCFRNTGAQQELSYASDPVKTGNFYIFDYAYYMASYNIPSDINVITIALSTNDYTLNGSEALERCKFGLTVMLTQIRAALPTVKIGVIPAPAQGMAPDGDSRFNDVANWINASQKLITDLGFSNVDVIGVWAHMSRYFNCDNAGTALLRQDGNSTLIYNNGEWIHFNQNGYKQYAPVVGNWIMNVV